MKPVHRILVLSAFLLGSSQVSAAYPGLHYRSSSSEFSSYGVYFYGGYGFGMTRLGSFKDFADSYNSYYGTSGQDILDSELKPFRTCSGYMFGGGIRIGPMCFSMSYVQMKSVTEVDIKGGNKRVFTYGMRIPARIGIGFCIPYVIAEFTTGFGTPYLMAGYQYTDGTISYGRERSLNGIYKTVGFTFGANVAGKFPIAKIFALTAGFAVDGLWGFGFEDVNWNKIFHYSGSYSQYFPTDIEEWNTNPGSYPRENAAQANGFSLYIWGGLTIQIPE